MTSAEIAGLRDFISVELGKVHDRVDQVYALQLDFQAHVATHFGEVYTAGPDGDATSGQPGWPVRRLEMFSLSARLDDVSARLDRLDDVSTRLSRVETRRKKCGAISGLSVRGSQSANRKN